MLNPEEMPKQVRHDTFRVQHDIFAFYAICATGSLIISKASELKHQLRKEFKKPPPYISFILV